MGIVLLVLLIISGLLIVISFIIIKSKLSENEKTNSLFYLLIFFSIIAILNEIKRSQVPKQRKNMENLQLIQNINESLILNDSKLINATDQLFDLNELKENYFENLFFSNESLSLNEINSIPKYEDFQLSVTDFQLNIEIDLKTLLEQRTDIGEFALFEGKPNIGKTYFIQEIAKTKQLINEPTLYLEIKMPIYSQIDFYSLLQIDSFQIMKKIIKKFNNESKVPTLFIDNADFLYSENSQTCIVCSLLKMLYDSSNINIFFITNNDKFRQFINTGNIFQFQNNLRY